MTKNIFVIEWFDAESDDDWEVLGDVSKLKPTKVYSVGYILAAPDKKGCDYYLLAGDYTDDGDHISTSRRMKIPACATISVRKL